MNTKHTQKKNRQRGFTMIETLVAIFILLVTTTGPLTFAQSGLRASFLARDQVVAFYLAQDAIETIKSLRDSNSLTGNDWLNSLDDCVSDNGCRMQTSPIYQTQTCSSRNICNPMKYDIVTKKFLLSELGSEKYTRRVYVQEIKDNREAQIIVTVEWDSNFFSEKRIVVQENIYNWVPNYAQQ